MSLLNGSGIPSKELDSARQRARFSSLILYNGRLLAAARRFDMGSRANFTSLPAAVRAISNCRSGKSRKISETAGALTCYLAEAAADWIFRPPDHCARLIISPCGGKRDSRSSPNAGERKYLSASAEVRSSDAQRLHTVEDGERLIACLRRFATIGSRPKL